MAGIAGRFLRDLVRVAGGSSPEEGTSEPDLRRLAQDAAGAAARGSWWRRQPKGDPGGPAAWLRRRLRGHGIDPAVLSVALSKPRAALLPARAQDLLRDVAVAYLQPLRTVGLDRLSKRQDSTRSACSSPHRRGTTGGPPTSTAASWLRLTGLRTGATSTAAASGRGTACGTCSALPRCSP